MTVFARILVAIILVALLPVAALADAGRVVDFDGDVQLMRSGEPVKILLGLTLLPGDEISVSDPGYLLFTSGADELRVDATRSPFVVADAAWSPFPDARMENTVAELMNWWGGDDQVLVRSRDTVPPDLASLPSGSTAYVLAGQRSLRLAPLGGKGPFALQLLHDGSPVAAVELQRDQPAAYLKAELIDGQDYELEIIDRGQGDLRRTYRLTAAAALPEFVGSEHLAAESKFDRLLAAGALSSTQGGAWAFEAVQQIQAIDWPVRASSALLTAIESGGHP